MSHTTLLRGRQFTLFTFGHDDVKGIGFVVRNAGKTLHDHLRVNSGYPACGEEEQCCCRCPFKGQNRPGLFGRKFHVVSASSPMTMQMTITGLRFRDMVCRESCLLCDTSLCDPRQWVLACLHCTVFQALHSLSHLGVKAKVHLVVVCFPSFGINKDISTWT